MIRKLLQYRWRNLAVVLLFAAIALDVIAKRWAWKGGILFTIHEVEPRYSDLALLGGLVLAVAAVGCGVCSVVRRERASQFLVVLLACIYSLFFCIYV